MQLHFTHRYSAAVGAMTLYRLLGLAIAVLIQSCSMLSPPKVRPAIDVTGMWQGSSFGACVARLPRCGDVVLISLVHDPGPIGNQRILSLRQGQLPVPQHEHRGKDRSRIDKRVQCIPAVDVRRCIELHFQRHLFAGPGQRKLHVLQGGGLVERGYWKVRREA
jgi:hypothetical protein